MAEYDFEGRCEDCGHRLRLGVSVISREEIRVTVYPCEEHPEGAIILWPQREEGTRELQSSREVLEANEEGEFPISVEAEGAYIAVCLGKSNKELLLEPEAATEIAERLKARVKDVRKYWIDPTGH